MKTGNLKIELPRQLIQAQDDITGQDIPYTVFVNGVTANFTEILGSSESRAIEIQFNQETSMILITGSWMVPEFLIRAVLLSIKGRAIDNLQERCD